MNQTIEDRMQAVEDELKTIRKELEESLARYKDRGWLSLKDPLYISFGMSEDHYWVSENDRVDVRVTKECKPFIKLDMK